MDLFEALGFVWDRKQANILFPTHSHESVCFHFHKNMAEFVWDASVLEGNPCTLPQVQTLMSGITVGGLKISDQDQVINLAKSCKELHRQIKSKSFRPDRATFLHLHSILAKEEALEWGVFRGEGKEVNYTPHVALGSQGSYVPLITQQGAHNLIAVFDKGMQALQTQGLNPFERAGAFFLFGALQQFFFDGNKRTSRLMMNGMMMSQGFHALSISAATLLEFNEQMVHFYKEKNATAMFDFLARCHPDYPLRNTP